LKIEGVFIRALCFLGECSSDSWMYVLEQKPVSNRTRVEILASILKVAGHRTLKTHIMYKANLRHRQLEKYLTFLENKGLLCQFKDLETGTNMYKVTEKGIQFLKEYMHLSEYFGEKPE
jgi:predicted transcriptional regulator